MSAPKPTLRIALQSSSLSGTYNKRICDYAQISQGETSHIPGMLTEIAQSLYKSVYKALEGVKNGN